MMFNTQLRIHIEQKAIPKAPHVRMCHIQLLQSLKKSSSSGTDITQNIVAAIVGVCGYDSEVYVSTPRVLRTGLNP